tara:strand:+ start:1579 stop:2334 length:756 start_codon:yes stop_codon:yes gene_type:complete
MSNKKQKVFNRQPENCIRVYFDFETTGRSRSQIVSIGYISEDETIQAELLCLPKAPIEPSACEVHGYTNLKLVKDGALNIKTQLQKFMNDIESLKVNVILCAHNGKAFDTNVLRHAMEREYVMFASNITGFVDTLHWFKYDIQTKEAKMDYLIMTYLQKDKRNFHGALEDSKLLKEVTVFALSNLSQEPFLTYFESFDDFMTRTSKWTSEVEFLRDLQEDMRWHEECCKCEHKTIKQYDNFQMCLDCEYLF